MKNKFLFLLMFIPAVVFAGGSFVVETATERTQTVSVVKANLEGYIESIYIDVTGTTTGTVAILTPYETVYTNTITSDTMVRPRLVAHNTTGGQLIGGTNDYQRVYMDYDSLTFYIYDTSPSATNSTVTYKFSVKMVKQLP